MSDWVPPSAPPPDEPVPTAPGGWTPPPGAAPPPGWAHPGSAPPGWAPHPGGWGRPPEIKPGVVPLRPLGLSEILDGAVALVRSHWRVAFGVAAAVMFVSQLLQLVLLGSLTRDAQNSLAGSDELDEIGSALGDVLAVTGGAALIEFAAGIVLTGILTAIVGKAVLGRPVQLGDEWRDVRPRLLPLVGASLLSLVLVLAAFLLPLVPGFLVLLAGSEGLAAFLLVVGVLAGIPLAAFVYVTLGLAAPALVLEKIGVRPALRRSRTLVRGSWWRVFGILALTAVIAYFIRQVLVTPFALIGAFNPLTFDLESAAELTLTQQLAMAIGNVLAGTVVTPFTAGVTALLYIDRRMRAEGLDVALQQSAREAVS